MSVSFSPDGKRIVSGSEDKTLKVWDSQTGQEKLTFKGHSEPVSSVSFSPDGKRIVSGSGRVASGEIKVWDAQTGQETLTLTGHSDWVESVSFSPDGKRIVSGSLDGTVKVWDARSLATSK
jgi:WD40 repeat protein